MEDLTSPFEKSRSQALEMLRSSDVRSFVLVVFDGEGRLGKKINASTNEMLVTEKVIAAFAEASLFSPKKKDDGGLG